MFMHSENLEISPLLKDTKLYKYYIYDIQGEILAKLNRLNKFLLKIYPFNNFHKNTNLHKYP